MKPEDFDVVAALQEGLKTQTYNDIQAKVITRDHHMREGETITADVTMVHDHEELFIAQKPTKEYTRNPTVFEGEYLNVHLDKYGELVINLRKTVLTTRKNALRDGEGIKTELLTAARVLGL